MGVGTRIVSTRAAVPFLGHARASRPCQARHTANGKVNFAIALHSPAMHLLQSGTDLAVIALWLGHSSPTVTHQYLEADLAAKKPYYRS